MVDGSQEYLGLPEAAAHTQAYVNITPFETGRMTVSTSSIVGGGPSTCTATSWRFFIEHSASKTKLWFDMGISTDLNDYPESVRKVHKYFNACPSKRSIVEDTVSMGANPADVEYIIVSHGHWDHVHPVPAEFSSVKVICGPNGPAHCCPNESNEATSVFDGRIWRQDKRTFALHELPSTCDSAAWARLGPFPHAQDFFGDGSLFLIDAPGHLPGNLAALARVRSREGGFKWVLLGGDCAHCNLFTYWPSAPFGQIPGSLMDHKTLHHDPVTARATITKIAECKRREGENLLVWYAHSEMLEGLWDLEPSR